MTIIEMTRAWQGLGYTDFAATPPAATSPSLGAARQWCKPLLTQRGRSRNTLAEPVRCANVHQGG